MRVMATAVITALKTGSHSFAAMPAPMRDEPVFLLASTVMARLGLLSRSTSFMVCPMSICLKTSDVA